MIKKYQSLLAFIFSFFIFFCFFNPVLAECSTCQGASNSFSLSNTGEASPAVHREKIRLFREKLKDKSIVPNEENAEKKEMVREMITEKTRARVRWVLGRLMKRFEHAIDRMEKIITRIESRIAKLKEDDDLDLSEVEANVEEAKELIAGIKEALGEIELAFDEVMESETPKDDFSNLHDLIRGLKDDLLEARKILIKAIRGLKTLTSSSEE